MMNSKSRKASAEKTVRDIRRATRKRYSAEEKIRIVLEGLRREASIAELCRTEGINQNLYYRWSKEFLEAGKKRLSGDTVREPTSDEVRGLRQSSFETKTVAEIAMSSGFWHLGNFARDYYEFFGERPSETLKASNARV